MENNNEVNSVFSNYYTKVSEMLPVTSTLNQWQEAAFYSLHLDGKQ